MGNDRPFTTEQLERIQHLEREWHAACEANDRGRTGGPGWESEAWDRLANFKTDLGLCLRAWCRKPAEANGYTCLDHSLDGRGRA